MNIGIVSQIVDCYKKMDVVNALAHHTVNLCVCAVYMRSSRQYSIFVLSKHQQVFGKRVAIRKSTTPESVEQQKDQKDSNVC
jgi:hypothetical protein